MKLVGYIDGMEVRFDFHPPNKFKADIPKKSDGTYIIQLIATDDAGNESSLSNIFVYINFEKMIFKALEGFKSVEESKDYGFIELNDEFILSEVESLSTIKELMQTYSYRELVI